MLMIKGGRRTIPSHHCLFILVISSFSAVLATVAAKGALVGVESGGGGGRRRRGRPSSSFSFLAPLSFSKIIAATKVTPTTSTTTLSNPLTFFHRRHQLWPRRRNRHRHHDGLTTMLSTTMTLLGGHDSGNVDGDETAEEMTMSTENVPNNFDSNSDGINELQQGEREVGAGEDELTSPTEAVEEGEKNIVAVHTYYRHQSAIRLPDDSLLINNDVVNDRSSNLTLMGVGMPSRQFASWVHYYLTHMTMDGEAMITPSTTVTATTALDAVSETSAAMLINQKKVVEEKRDALNRILQLVSTQEMDWDSEWEGDGGDEISREAEATWLKIRQFWKEGKLICENTSLLTSSRGRGDYRRRHRLRRTQESEGDELNSPINTEDEVQQQEDEEQRYRQEKFRNALGSYAERLVSIVEDEMIDNHHSTHDEDAGIHCNRLTSSNRLLGWIEDEYGIDGTRELMADLLLNKSEKEQLETFQTFLNWFRTIFPYFHDKCDFCGASCKDDPVQEVNRIPDDDDNAVQGDDDETQLNDDHINGIEQNDEKPIIDDFSCLGYVYPTPTELRGGASRTELYRCRSCNSYTRFPRYNKARWITTARRGRCGEYSVLLYRMLRALGYVNVRWCVDWADHVWVEVWLDNESVEANDGDVKQGGRWVHLDPCEAAVDTPLLYESWGKNQTYIVAFHDPFYSNLRDRAMCIDLEVLGRKDYMASATTIAAIAPQERTSKESTAEKESRIHRFPLVEDVTRQYTSDEVHVIVERRGIGDELVAQAIQEVSVNMVDLFKNLTQRSL